MERPLIFSKKQEIPVNAGKIQEIPVNAGKIHGKASLMTAIGTLSYSGALLD